MRDLTIPDSTQLALLPHLARTERLLARAASRESGRACDVEVVAMSDLGLANNPRRMLGGFFTGAFYRWEGTTPLVPVDATVNVCSISLHRVAQTPTSRYEFEELIEQAQRRCAHETEYSWNLDVGNHFATFGTIAGSTVVPDGSYLLLHASAAEYKRTPGGLYPTEGVWYADAIRTVDDGERSLRYVAGAPAERFISLAHSLVDYNSVRHRVLAELIAGELGVESYACLPHYGMPDDHSIAIGCHWLDLEVTDFYPLLTKPDEDVLLIAPDGGGRNQVEIGDAYCALTPHGLGLRVDRGAIAIDRERLSIDGEPFDHDASVLASAKTTLRSMREPGLERKILNSAPGRVVGRFSPNYSHYKGALAMSPSIASVK
jgi:hypothetical protein